MSGADRMISETYKGPKTSRWVLRGDTSGLNARARAEADRQGIVCIAHYGHRHDGTTVLSALEIANAPDGNGAIPQWHVSISKQGARPDADTVARVLRDFDLEGAEEDNHHPGVARHFWMPVDPTRRVDCECKSDETVVTEADGYQWTNPVTGPCRGCDLERTTGRACPLHPKGHGP
jgi:hypothetical protein